LRKGREEGGRDFSGAAARGDAGQGTGDLVEALTIHGSTSSA
jgi:hypothetical protein